MSRILLGVSGGIAAYKALELVRLATAAGHAVRVVQTPASRRFVGAASFAALSGAPVLHSEFARDPARGAFPDQQPPSHEPLSHLELVANADVLLIAPASANTIAKLAAGLADNLLTSCALAASCPLVVAPAMNNHMYEHPATRANLQTLRERGATVLEPDAGRLASKGEHGIGRLPDPERLLEACEQAIAPGAGPAGAAPSDASGPEGAPSPAATGAHASDAPAGNGQAPPAGGGSAGARATTANAGQVAAAATVAAPRGAAGAAPRAGVSTLVPSGGAGTLAGLHVLVTAGGTREPIDSVRFIGNSSSGRMGFALAQAAQERGAQVTLVAANVVLPTPAGVLRRDVHTAAELQHACEQVFASCDVLLMAAAVADFRPARAENGKIKKARRSRLELTLEPTADVLTGLASRRRESQTLVGFAAEHGSAAVADAEAKLAGKGVDAIVVNDISREDIGFEVDANEVTILSTTAARDSVKRQHVPRAGKKHVAGAILDAVERLRASG